MDKAEVKKLIKKELDSVLKDVLKDEIVKVYKDRKNKDLFKDIVRDAMVNFYRFLYTQRSVWEKKL